LRFRTKEEFLAWFERNRDKIEEFNLKADENARLYHEIVFANGKETYYYRGNPFEKGRNPRTAVWHVIGRNIRRPSTTRWSPQGIVTQEMVTEPFKYLHEALEEGKVYLVSGWNEKGFRKGFRRGGGVGLIYIPPQDSFSDEMLEFAREWLSNGFHDEAESKLVWLIDHYNIQRVHPAKPEPGPRVVKLTFLPDWVASFVEYPLGEIRPSLNYPRGEFHS
tara:strand:+ start:2424 stop:3083 length:660 start_codon:yes stop_codon:yes gene_type:complete